MRRLLSSSSYHHHHRHHHHPSSSPSIIHPSSIIDHHPSSIIDHHHHHPHWNRYVIKSRWFKTRTTCRDHGDDRDRSCRDRYTSTASWNNWSTSVSAGQITMQINATIISQIYQDIYRQSAQQYFPLVLIHCLFGERKGIRPVKSWVLVCWWWCDWSFARLRAAVCSCQPSLPSSLAPMKPANPRSAGNMAVKRRDRQRDRQTDKQTDRESSAIDSQHGH